MIIILCIAILLAIQIPLASAIGQQFKRNQAMIKIKFYNDRPPLAIHQDDAPRNGYVIEPMPSDFDMASSIICGHEVIQVLSEDQQALFEIFVKEVLRTIVGRLS
jgi:hypothetical protein